QEIKGLLIGDLEARHPARAWIIGRAAQCERLGYPVVGDGSTSDGLIEEIVDPFVEAVDRQRADPREIPFEGEVELVRQSRPEVRIARCRGQLTAIVVERGL